MWMRKKTLARAEIKAGLCLESDLQACRYGKTECCVCSELKVEGDEITGHDLLIGYGTACTCYSKRLRYLVTVYCHECVDQIEELTQAQATVLPSG